VGGFCAAVLKKGNKHQVICQATGNLLTFRMFGSYDGPKLKKNSSGIWMSKDAN